MRKPVIPFPFATGTSNRFGRSSLGGGVSPTNSNTRVYTHGAPARAVAQAARDPSTMVNLGLNSERSRGMMIERLRRQGIQDERVLDAMMAVPRHLFVDQGLASRAYEDAALPIGHGQTISQPWVVARMISVVCENKAPAKVLEVGAGCGYQAAVLAQFIKEIHAVERIRGLYDMARDNLRALKLSSRVRLAFGNGMEGLPGVAPFDAIIIAAAGIRIPQALLEQLAVGGRLIAPEGTTAQRLILIERTGASSWHRAELESVRFVPLLAGTQS
ncbi:protein-L-isoaspartate(D-aspartate) O-methyltransferase [Parapusillimonas granuli]|uniref:Protein-L-isoaspartate O-methyltransferase n=1 Tax=Parapusillimonas granuli TaxID=380911 RepID=A0A853G3R5_9BURK|nr:protein-L-isoaspartate(D-aspartate) O-methyltransferase [Parapusillimonas granuli]NYT50482.1 protein-L-isoaspartate(D-aspartate) O-methyltransferase [Parapusillimonas granuli]